MGLRRRYRHGKQALNRSTITSAMQNSQNAVLPFRRRIKVMSGQALPIKQPLELRNCSRDSSNR